ncbi:hypothetical protein VUR80DRAFT_7141 [Thermomyces stellatus]
MPLRGSAAKGREFAGAEIPAAACTKYGPRWFAGKNERRQNNSLRNAIFKLPQPGQCSPRSWPVVRAGTLRARPWQSSYAPPPLQKKKIHRVQLPLLAFQHPTSTPRTFIRVAGPFNHADPVLYPARCEILPYVLSLSYLRQPRSFKLNTQTKRIRGARDVPFLVGRPLGQKTQHIAHSSRSKQTLVDST